MTDINYIGVTELAKRLDLSPKTIYTWIQSGRILAQSLPNGRYRIPESEIGRLMGLDREPGGASGTA